MHSGNLATRKIEIIVSGVGANYDLQTQSTALCDFVARFEARRRINFTELQFHCPGAQTFYRATDKSAAARLTACNLFTVAPFH
jgi:hypothetical protein